jgi:hypothetical protein
MSTFVSTTLAKRIGATTTTFTPSGIDNGFGYFRASGTHALNGPSVRVEQKVRDSYRRTSTRLMVPQLDSDGRIVLRPAIDMSLYVPAGTLSDDVNDLVGYLHALTDSSLTNFNDIFVDGVGLY